MLYAPACKNLTLPIVLNPPLPGRFVGRMQYAPTRGRKLYAWDCGIRDWGRKWYVRGGIYPIRFIIPPLRYEK